MSDFGVIITFKKSGSSLSDTDRKSILTNFNKIVDDGEYSSHIKSRSSFKFYKLDGVDCIKLTEYYEDEDADEIREFAEEMDMEEASEIIDSLKAVTDSSIEVEARFLDW